MNPCSASIATVVAAAAMLLASLPTQAQEATTGTAPKPRATTNAPQPGMGWRMHRNNTPGWAMMTRQERDEHHRTMMDMKDHGACQTYMQEHHAKMVDRAKERGRTMPAMPPQDGCARLKR